MALFEKELLDSAGDDYITKNPYLDNSSKGLQLVRKILSQGTDDDTGRKRELRNIIAQRIIPLIARAELEGESRAINDLTRIISRLRSSDAISLIASKKIIGIGGRFSAGKSCFINSIVSAGKQILPEGLTPTTSISTYIVNGTKRKNIISTTRGSDITMDDKAVIALTHDFYEKYGIGFSKYISNLVLETPLFGYENVAILDTPGYNKYDVNVKQEASDSEKARVQLQTVDRIIWLIDIENGTIKEEDILFLEKIAPSYPVLFVINKADKRTEDNLRSIIESTRQALAYSDIPCYDVVGYSSRDASEILSDDVILQYIKDANETTDTDNCILSEIISICENVIGQLTSQIDLLQDEINGHSHIIRDNADLINAQSLIVSYRQCNVRLFDVLDMRLQMQNILNDLNKYTI